MKLSCAFAPGPEVVDLVRVAEDLGYDTAWVYDSPALYGDCWMQLALCAAATSRIGLGPGVAIPSLRHPMVTASAIATLEHLAPGRARAAFGTGFTGRFVMGQPPLTWRFMEQYLRQVRALLAGETVDIEGKPCRMIHPPGYAPERPIGTPIIVGANGPKGEAVARAIDADGVMTIFGGRPGWDHVALFAYGTVLDDDEPIDSPRVLDAAGPGGAVVFHGMYEADPASLDALPGGPEWRAAIEAFPAGTRHLHTHELHFVGMTERDRAAVSGELLAATTWTGTRDTLRARVEALVAEGVTELAYAPMGPDPRRELEAMRSVFG